MGKISYSSQKLYTYLYNLMLQVNSNKQQKTALNLYSSHYENPIEIETSMKRKVFTRKPSNNPSITSDKRKKNAAEAVTTKTIVEQLIKEKSIVEPLANMVAINRKERQTENFYKDKDLVKQFAHKYSKGILTSPQSQKNLLLAGLQSNGLNKKKIEPYNFDQQQNRKPGVNKVYRVANQTQERYQDQSDMASVQSFKNSRSVSNASNSQKSSSYKNMMNYDYKYGGQGKRDLDEENMLISECFYCKNNKRIVDILTEKQRKLEEQYKSKINVIKQLTDKCEHLKKENSNLYGKIQQNLEISQAKQSYFFREKQQLVGEIEQLKYDVSMLTERIKYDQIQNSMLLRYKDEYQLLTRQFDDIRHQNQQLKRQLATFQNQNRFIFNKSKASPVFTQLKPQNQKKYQFYNKKISPNEKDKYLREDDDISLTLSEQSTDQS